MVNLDEMPRAQLAEIIERYPWFTAARITLCSKLLAESGHEAAEGLYRNSMAFLPVGERLSYELHASVARDYSDADTYAAIRDIIEKRSRIVFDGTDFFSRNEYESIKQSGEWSLGKLAKVDYSEPEPVLAFEEEKEENVEMISETLAQIYAEQGYPERAVEIYKSLSLQSPEKSAYFASLIENLKS